MLETGDFQGLGTFSESFKSPDRQSHAVFFHGGKSMVTLTHQEFANKLCQTQKLRMAFAFFNFILKLFKQKEECATDHNLPWILKYFLSGPLLKRFANLWSKP